MQWLTKLDFKILHSIQGLSCSTLDFLMPKITILGNGGILWVLIAIFLLFNSRTRKNGIQLGAGCVGCVLIGNLLLKNIVARNRPCWIEEHAMLIAMPNDYSFPSGHTAASFASVSALYFAGRKRMAAGAFVLSVLIAFSRMYLYVHYPTDVLGGLIIGLLCGWIADMIIQKVMGRKSRKSR